MTELVARARAALNLILAATLLMGWTLLRPTEDYTHVSSRIVEEAKRIAEYDNRFDGIWHSEETQAPMWVYASLRQSPWLEIPFDRIEIFLEDHSELPREHRPHPWVVAAVRRLDKQRREAGLPKEATIKLIVGMSEAPGVKVPVLEQSVGSAEAPVLLAWLISAAFLYLSVVLRTIRQEAAFLDSRAGTDFVLHQRGVDAWVVGMGWLAAPPIVLVAGVLGGQYDGGWKNLLCVLSALSVLSLATMCSAQRTRVAFRSALDALEKQPVERAVDGPAPPEREALPASFEHPS